MQFDFTSIIDRHGKDATAIDGIGKLPAAPKAPKEGFDAIPMWVADMNFPTAPCIQKAMADRIMHPCFGYFQPSKAYYEGIIDWQKTQNGIESLLPENISYENGVLGGLLSALSIFCSKGDKVLLHSPTYVGFTRSLINNGYTIVSSPLYRDEEGIWRIDYEDMEKKLREEKIHASIFCSPHNPSGRVWESWELEKLMALYEKYDVQVISDEIWSDIIMPGFHHIPTQSVSDYAKMHTIALYAPSKTFNLAGLVGAYHICYNKTLQDRMEKEASLSHYNSMNVLSMHALIGAYSEEGKLWLKELLSVLSENRDFACAFIKENFPEISVMKSQGTYMLFLDCAKYLESHKISLEELEKRCWEVGVAVQDGKMFHGMTHLRMNLALPKSRVEEAFRRLKEYVFV